MSEQEHPRKYQGYGVVEGELILGSHCNRLVVAGTEFPVHHAVRDIIKQKHLPGQPQRFSVFPRLRAGRLGFRLLKFSPNKAVGIKLKGCWEQFQGDPYLVVYRNSLDSSHDSVWRIFVPIYWKNAPNPDGQFWELEAEVGAEGLKIIAAQGPFDPPLKAIPDHLAARNRSLNQTEAASGPMLHRVKLPPPIQRTAEKKAARITHNASRINRSPLIQKTTSAPATDSSLTLQEIRAMATPAKIQLTCKITQVPDYRQLSNQTVEFFLDDGNGHLLTVRTKLKMFKKLTDHGYAEWIAAISGDLGATTETGFELENGSIQVFEKKAKSEVTEGNKQVVKAEPKEESKQKDSVSPSEGSDDRFSKLGQRSIKHK